MIQEPTQYEEWLTTIANTRLIYNTMDELESMMDNHSIHSNGIKRSLPTPQKLRSAFRDLKVEVNLMTDDVICLDKLMLHYKKAWSFYRDNLYRRANPEEIALSLIAYFYPPYIRENIPQKLVRLFSQIDDQKLNIPFVLLMLLKVIPGYDSKEGDVIDMPRQYEKVMQLLEHFCSGCMFSVLPFITRAREKERKTRLMLLYYVSLILDTYESYADNENIYDTASDIKESRINLDIVGFWNEHDGQLVNTDFWQIEDACDYGTYFMTYWHKDAENRLTGIRYTLFLVEGNDGGIVYYMVHPEAIKHRMDGLPYGDSDHVWYTTEMLDDCPDKLPLQRMMFSGVWPQNINLTRCADEKVLALYDRWLNHDCDIVKKYANLEYEFHPTLYAITQTHLYIPTEKEGVYYKIAKDAYEGFDRIQMSDDVGTMIMNGKTYLAFDELMLYVPATKKDLLKYGIEKVSHIE